MLINLRNALMSGKADPFAAWYPRWGTDDIVVAFNGIYNAGANAAHSSTAQSWVDVATGKEAVKFSSSYSSPVWTDVGLSFDSIRRALRLNQSFGDITKGFTFDAFGYWGINWGVMASVSQSTTAGTECMPSGNNVGATINLHRTNSALYAEYYVQGRPTTTGLCLTCDNIGNIVIYENGNAVLSTQSGTAAFNKCKTLNRIVIGGGSGGTYPPNGSILYGLTLYRDALTPSEVASLYAANLKNYIGQ